MFSNPDGSDFFLLGGLQFSTNFEHSVLQHDSFCFFSSKNFSSMSPLHQTARQSRKREYFCAAHRSFALSFRRNRFGPNDDPLRLR